MIIKKLNVSITTLMLCLTFGTIALPAISQAKGNPKVVAAIYSSSPFYHNWEQYPQCNATQKVQAMCSGKTACALTPDNSLCGDPQEKATKFLHVEYTCEYDRKDYKLQTWQLDGKHLIIACPGRPPAP